MEECLEDSCERPHYGRGYCRLHYDRVRRAGLLKPRTLEQRFWQYVQKGPDCWLWTGGTTGEYGVFRGVTTTVRAHRQAWELLRGPIPEGLQIDHLCRNPICVNPDHLEPVTQTENVLRGIGPTARNAMKEHCHVGHEPNWYVRPDGTRQCRECRKVSVQRYKAKLRAQRQR